MRILYISQYFPPEAGATQARAYEMTKNWVNLGHKVTMITEIPNHPSGIIPAEYKSKFIEHKDLDGIDVFRVWVKTSPIKSFKNRMFFYLSFMINTILTGLLLAREKYDFIYATSPPLFVGGAALALCLFKRIPMIFEVRDLWPESAVALGEIKNPRIISIATKLELICYRKAIKIIVVTRGIHEHLVNRGIPSEKLIYIPNGANIDLFKYDQNGREQIRGELALDDKFISIYAGIHGLAQGLEVILETAQILLPHKDIYFILIGDGPKKAEISALAKRYNLPNLSLLPEKPREKIPAYLSAADVALIPLKKAEIFKGVLPSKIFDAWACKRPIIVSIDGEARELVEKIHGGLYIPAENPSAMAEAILYLKNSSFERQSMGENGLKYTTQYHSRASLAKLLISQLEAILKS